MMDETNVNLRTATNNDCARIQALVLEVLREYGLQPDLDGTDQDLSDIEANYTNRGGVFHVLEDAAGNLLGTVGLYPMDGETIELRKMYFAKDFRGKGYGQKALARMIDTARGLGFKKIYLETASALREAVHIYEKFGFKPTSEKHTPRCDQGYLLILD
jgi:putative acetyltransferase